MSWNRHFITGLSHLRFEKDSRNWRVKLWESGSEEGRKQPIKRRPTTHSLYRLICFYLLCFYMLLFFSTKWVWTAVSIKFNTTVVLIWNIKYDLMHFPKVCYTTFTVTSTIYHGATFAEYRVKGKSLQVCWEITTFLKIFLFFSCASCYL